MADPSHTFILASEILSMIPSLSLDMTKAPRKELEKLRGTIENIQSVLPDAQRHLDSADVTSWILNVSSILNQLHTLFINQNSPKNRTHQLKEVLLLLSSMLTSNPFDPNDSFTKDLKLIRTCLISEAKPPSTLAMCHFERPSGETHGFLDPRVIVGRDGDENSILELLFGDEGDDSPSFPIIALASVEGMGKTRLAQFIFNHERVQANYENRWWAPISFVGHEKEVLGRIFHSMSLKNYEHFSTRELKSEIEKLLSGSGQYLLVLDDVWDNNLAVWSKVMSFILSATTNRSKIIVTTRFLSVPRILQKEKCHVHQLSCLPEAKSWELFKMIAITPEKEEDPKWEDLGREIVKKCANVPLVIISTASLLCKQSTISDWETFASKHKLPSASSVLAPLILKYGRLPSKLRHCFAYCSLFPKDHIILKQKLIYLWIAQGFIKLGNHETLEATGHAYFMELFRRGFFQEAKVDDNGDILSCKMLSIFSDLAQDVAPKSVMLKLGEDQLPKRIRHASFGYEIDTASNIHLSVLDQTKRLRSLLTLIGKSCSWSFLDEQVTKFTSLRALDLHGMNIENVPSSISELKDLRYLNLSENTFSALPDSIITLENLLTIDISCCRHLEALPNELRKLTNLRHLDMSFCDSLRHMPPRFGELTCLVHLSDFKVSKECSGANSKSSSGLEALDRMMNLRGKLAITFDYRGAWLRDDTVLECNHIPKAIDQLTISDYPIPNWWKVSQDTTENNLIMSKLEHLVLIRCKLVKNLPPFHSLPVLRVLQLYHLQELQYIDEKNVELFPCLERLELVDLPKLKGWSKKETSVEAGPICHLTQLEIKYCHQLVSIPPSRKLQRLWLEETRKELVYQLVSSSPALQEMTINWCIEVKRLACGDLAKLRKVGIRNCPSLKTLQCPPVNGVEEITISNCTDLKLWHSGGEEEGERGVDWSWFPKLRRLNLDQIPATGTLPDCLGQLVDLGQLRINQW